MPEDVAKAAVPPSRDATLSSKTPTVGFEILLYICPVSYTHLTLPTKA